MIDSDDLIALSAVIIAIAIFLLAIKLMFVI